MSLSFTLGLTILVKEKLNKCWWTGLLKVRIKWWFRLLSLFSRFMLIFVSYEKIALKKESIHFKVILSKQSWLLKCCVYIYYTSIDVSDTVWFPIKTSWSDFFFKWDLSSLGTNKCMHLMVSIAARQQINVTSLLWSGCMCWQLHNTHTRTKQTYTHI